MDTEQESKKESKKLVFLKYIVKSIGVYWDKVQISWTYIRGCGVGLGVLHLGGKTIQFAIS